MATPSGACAASAQRPGVVPIPGSRTTHQIRDDIEEAPVELHPQILARVDQALAGFTPRGATLI